MTDIVAPPAVIVPPEFPALGHPDFNNIAYNWGTTQPSVSIRIGEIAQATHQLATAAQERAVAANASAVSAAGSAASAAADAERLAELDALWLGAHAADPTTGRDGAALVAGNAYVNTLTKAVRAYDGQAWGQGVGAVAGVNSLNGQAGDLVRETLAAYGITDIGTGEKGAVDLRTLTTSGVYTFAAGSTHTPAGVDAGVVFVARHGDVLGQLIVDAHGSVFSCGATNVSDAPVFSDWHRAGLHNDVAVPLAGGDINCALGNDFTEIVNGNRALAFSNVPSGSYSCVLEINHIAGTLTLPAGSVIANGATLDLSAGKRHLLFFKKAQLETAGWYVSNLPNFPT